MSYSMQCPECKAEWIPLDDVSAEFKYNVLKAENAQLREALEKIIKLYIPHEDWECRLIAKKVLEKK